MQDPRNLAFSDIKRAAHGLAPFIIRSPLISCSPQRGGREVRLKAENLQPTGSFKIRGSVNAIQSLTAQEIQGGVYTASAGNFGQGLAMAAALKGVPVTVHVPQTAAEIKIQALKKLHATVVRHTFEAWWDIMQARKVEGAGGVFVHPFADLAVIAGNATIGLEIVEDWPEVEAIIVPMGGGGLALGVAIGAKMMKPEVRLIVCETEAATPLTAAFAAGQPVEVPYCKTTFITGMGSSSVSPEVWPYLQTWVDAVVAVPVAAVADTVRFIAAEHHMIAEGAGAASLAAAHMYEHTGNKVVAVISGGNIDAAVLADILTKNKAG